MDTTASAMAKFEQAAESIRADIRRGVFKAGEKLPATDDVAERYGVARATAQKAVDLLHRERWVTKRASVGVFVNEPPAETEDVDLQAMRREVTVLRTEVDDLTLRMQRLEREHNDQS